MLWRARGPCCGGAEGNSTSERTDHGVVYRGRSGCVLRIVEGVVSQFPVERHNLLSPKAAIVWFVHNEPETLSLYCSKSIRHDDVKGCVDTSLKRKGCLTLVPCNELCSVLSREHGVQKHMTRYSQPEERMAVQVAMREMEEEEARRACLVQRAHRPSAF